MHPLLNCQPADRGFHISESVCFSLFSWTSWKVIHKATLTTDKTTRSIWKMLGPFASASRRTPLFYIAIHQVSLLLHAACAIDVHNNDDDNNDNAWQRGPLWPHRMGPTIQSKRDHLGEPVIRREKIGTIILYAFTSSNINRFSKLFHCQNQEKNFQ